VSAKSHSVDVGAEGSSRPSENLLSEGLGFDTLDPLRQEAISATDRSSNAALAASFNLEGSVRSRGREEPRALA
jgi:hypothetical protein